MRTYLYESKKTKSNAAANSVVQKNSYMQEKMQFVDNRAQSIKQRKMKEIAMLSATAPTIQRAPTSINYNASTFDMENGKKEVVGHEMIANINPNDKVKGSSPGNGVQAELMQEFKNVGYRRMIRGHLMNGQLGGLGIAANLFPITSQANAKHKNHVENPIKEQIRQGKEIEYKVSVQSQNKMSSPAANFVCSARATDNSWARDETITSIPGKTSTRGDNIEGDINNGTGGMKFRSADLPSGFGESSSGYTGSAAHQNTAGKSTFSLDGSNMDVDASIYAHGYHFNSGVVDRQGYANELIGKYNGDPANNWPIYFDGNPYKSQELEDLIDIANAGDVERIIAKLESLL